MESPAEKYHNNPEFRSITDLMESFIHRGKITPMELREAATLACINFEMKNVHRHIYPMTLELENALKEIYKYCHDKG